MKRNCHRPTGLSIACAGLAAAVLTACGGGGGSAGTPDSPPGGRPEPLTCTVLPAEVTWFSGTASNEWNDVLIDARNRIWLAGYADSSGDSDIGPTGNSRAVLRLLAPDGHLLWESGSEFDTPGTDVAEALALSPQGMVVMAGRTTGAFTSAPNAGQFDTFVAWSDAAGPVSSWRFFQTGSATPQHVRRVQIAPDGDVVLAGYDDIYIPSNYVAAWSDSFATRLRRQGAGTANDRLEPLWHHQFQTAEPDFVEGLALASSGAETYVSGQIQQGASRGMFVRKLDAQGQALWTARYSTLSVDSIAVLKAMPDGTLLMAGSVFGPFHGGRDHGQQDVFVARIAADDGRLLQSWQFGSSESEWLTDMKLDSAGNIYLLGETQGVMAAGASAMGSTDLFMLKISPEGNLLGSRQWGTAGDDTAKRLAVDSCGHVVAVGSSMQNQRRSGLIWAWQP